MAKKLSDEVLKWTIEINGDQARKSLHELEQTTRELEGTNKILKTELAKLEAQGKKNTAEYDAISQSITNNNKAIQGNKQQMAALREEIGITGLTMRELRSRAKELQNQLDNMTPDSEDYNRLKGDLIEVKSRMDELRVSTKSMGADQNNLKKTTEGVQQSLGEMKRELRALRNMSFAGMNPEEIKQVRARMAELTDQIGDFQAQIKTASADAIPAIINGLQGMVAIAQGVTSTMAMFGVENEDLEKKMVALIGASQSLATIYELYEKKTLSVMTATLKNTAAKVKETAAIIANSVATSANAAKMSALEGGAGKARAGIAGFVGGLKGLKSGLVGVVGAAGAAVAIFAALMVVLFGGMYLLSKYHDKVHGITKRKEEYNRAVKATVAIQEKAAEQIGNTQAKLATYLKVVNDTTLSEGARKLALQDIAKETGNVITITDLNTRSLKYLNEQVQKYIGFITIKAKADAASMLLTEKYTEIMKLEASQVSNMGDYQKRQEQIEALKAETEIYLQTFIDLQKQATEAENEMNIQQNATYEEYLRDKEKLEEDNLTGKLKSHEEYLEKLAFLEDYYAKVIADHNKKPDNPDNASSKDTKAWEAPAEADDDAAQKRYEDNFNYMVSLQEREAAEKKRIRDAEEAERNKQADAILAEADQQFQKDMANIATQQQLRKDLQLQTDQEIYDESKKQLDFYLQQKYISEAEHTKLVEKLNADLAAKRMESWKNTLTMTQELTGSFLGVIQGMMDAELEMAGENEAKQKSIKKKYADVNFVAAIANMLVNSALGVTQIWGQWGAYPPVAALLTAGLVAATIPQILIANAQRQKVKQLASGNVAEVVGASDGKKYSAEMLKKVGTGLYNKPYMALFNENPNRPELVVDGATTHKLRMKYPEVVDTIRYVSQHATGKYDSINYDKSSSNSYPSNAAVQQQSQLNVALIESIDKLNSNIENGIGVNYDKLNQSSSDIAGIYSRTER